MDFSTIFLVMVIVIFLLFLVIALSISRSYKLVLDRNSNSLEVISRSVFSSKSEKYNLDRVSSVSLAYEVLSSSNGYRSIPILAFDVSGSRFRVFNFKASKKQVEQVASFLNVPFSVENAPGLIHFGSPKTSTMHLNLSKLDLEKMRDDYEQKRKNDSNF